MFARVFIDRPVLAWVISIVIVLFGLAALVRLPITQYPEITPPTVTVTGVYPGANATTVADTVAAPIETQVNGVENMLYMSSSCGNDGSYTLTVTFEIGTNLDTAQVLVQNRVQQALPQLPQEVQRQGLIVRKRSANILLVVNIYSPDNSRDQLYLSNYATIQVRDDLARIKGVGDAMIFGQQDYSMRAWLDPEKLAYYGLTVTDVANAIREQNVQVAAGQLGQEPTVPGQSFQYTLSTLGRLNDVEQFRNIIVKVAPDPDAADESTPADLGPLAGGAALGTTMSRPIVRLKDIARLELTAKSRDMSSAMDGQATVGVAIFQLPGSNALDTADTVKARMEQLKKRFPPGVDYKVRYDTTPFIRQSVDEVFNTLIDAIILVAFVVLLFLQDWRAMILPMIDVPVSLIGTLAVMHLFGFSLNNLTMFGLVLAIGIVVDDAIVVLENVETWIAKGYDSREATIKAMGEITGPIIAITLVLCCVFIPSAMIGGITGQFYKQFALTISVAMLISAVNAMTLTPSRAAAIFRAPKGGGHRVTETMPRWGWALFLGWAGFRIAEFVAHKLGGHLPLIPDSSPTLIEGDYPTYAEDWAIYAARHAPYFLPGIIVGAIVAPYLNAILRVFYKGFNWAFTKATLGYKRIVGWMLRGAVIVLLLYLVLVGATYKAFTSTPTGFIPMQDQGYLIVAVQLPDAASYERTDAVMKQADEIIRKTLGVKGTVAINGMSFVMGANGSNFGSIFVILEGFDTRTGDPQQNGFVIMQKIQASLTRDVQDAQIAVFPPPPVMGLGSAGGYRIMVEDRGDLGPQGLQTEVNSMIGKMREDKELGPAFTVYRANVPQLFVDVDRVRCKQMGVPLTEVFAALQAFLGGQYVNDFNRFGRNWQVNIQADAKYRMEAEAIRNFRVRNDRGEMVPLRSVATIEDAQGPVVIQRYNTFPAAAINGNLPPGASTGESIKHVEKAADEGLSSRASTEWTDLFYLQITEGSSSIYAFLGAVVLVYLVLAAQYDSWSLPFAVILVVPMCMFSALAGVWGLSPLFGMKPEMNIFTQVGLIVLVGLASKNAILIVEFAEKLRKSGKPLREATLTAVQMRLRPIIMTSFAFVLGVVPLVLAKGAGAEMRITLGIAVFSGMIGVTFFGIFLTPVLYYSIEWLIGLRRSSHLAEGTPNETPGSAAGIGDAARGEKA